MTREKAIYILERFIVYGERQKEALNLAIEALKAEPKPKWIPIKTRPMTKEEWLEWEERTGEKLIDEYAVYYDCPMPYDGQKILICSKWGDVSVDECVVDEYGIGLDSNDDWDCITAWMLLPEPYKEVKE